MRKCGECRLWTWDEKSSPPMLGGCVPLPYRKKNARSATAPECFFFKDIEEPEEDIVELPEENTETEAEKWQRVSALRRATRE